MSSVYPLSLDALAERRGMSTDSFMDTISEHDLHGTHAHKNHITKGGIMPRSSEKVHKPRPAHNCGGAWSVEVCTGKRRNFVSACCEADRGKSRARTRTSSGADHPRRGVIPRSRAGAVRRRNTPSTHNPPGLSSRPAD